METDRELLELELELAAKAAGLKINYWTSANGVPVAVLADGGYLWQPLLRNLLTDCMGDALRLAVKLKFVVDFCYKGGTGVWLHEAVGPPEFWSAHGTDASAAIRKTILRAAAEVGRRM